MFELFFGFDVIATIAVLFFACLVIIWADLFLEAPAGVAVAVPILTIVIFLALHYGVTPSFPIYVPPFEFSTLFTVAAYLVVGVVFALVEWRFVFIPDARRAFDQVKNDSYLPGRYWPGDSIEKRSAAYDKWEEEQDANRTAYIKERDRVTAGMTREAYDKFMKEVKGEPVDPKIALHPDKFPTFQAWLKKTGTVEVFDMEKYAPNARYHKMRIGNWVVYWPGYVAYHSLIDSFRWIGNAFYTVFGGLLNRLSISAFKKEPL